MCSPPFFFLSVRFEFVFFILFFIFDLFDNDLHSQMGIGLGSMLDLDLSVSVFFLLNYYYLCCVVYYLVVKKKLLLKMFMFADIGFCAVFFFSS